MPDPLDLTFAVLRGEEGPGVIPLCVLALSEADERIQLRAAVLLLARGDPEGMRALRRGFARLSAPAREALVRDTGAFPQYLLEALREPEAEERLASVACLAALDGARGVAGLLAALDDPLDAVRARAAEALADLACAGPPQARLRAVSEALLVALRNFRQHRQIRIFEAMLADPGMHRTLLNVAAEPGDVRQEAFRALLERSVAPEAAAFLFKMLREPRERVREDAARILAARAADASFHMALWKMLDAEEPRALSRLVAAQESIPWWPADPALAPVPLQRHLAGLLREARALPALDRIAKLANLLASADAGVRTQAAEQLAESRDPAAEAALWTVLEDPEPAVQAAAVRAMVVSNHPDKRRILAGKLNHPSSVVSAVAREAVSREGFHQYLASFPRMDEATRGLAAKALAKVDPDLSRRVGAEIAGLDPDRRLRAVHLVAAAEKSGDLVPMLLALMKDPDHKVRATVVRALGKATSREALHGLVMALTDRDRRVRANAIEAIGIIGDSRLASLVAPFLGAPDPRSRSNALKALWRMGRRDIVGALDEMLRDPSEPARVAAVWALGEIDCEGRRERLLRLQEGDPSQRVRMRARRLLSGGAP